MEAVIIKKLLTTRNNDIQNVQDMFKLGSKVSLDTGMAKKNDLVVVIAGMPIGIPGNTNLMRVIHLPEPSN